MTVVLAILVLAFVIEQLYMPRFDHNEYGQLMLYYGRKDRKFIFLS